MQNHSSWSYNLEFNCNSFWESISFQNILGLFSFWLIREHHSKLATQKNEFTAPNFEDPTSSIIYSDVNYLYINIMAEVMIMSTGNNWRNKQQLDQCKIPSDGVPIGSGTFATIFGGIIIQNPWSNKSDANLEGSACTVRMLLFLSIHWK